MNTTPKFDSGCRILEEKIKTSLVSLSLIMKKRLCTCRSFLQPKRSISFLCLPFSKSVIYLICLRSKRLFKNAWQICSTGLGAVRMNTRECSLWLGTAFLIWSDIRWHPWMLFLNHWICLLFQLYQHLVKYAAEGTWKF